MRCLRFEPQALHMICNIPTNLYTWYDYSMFSLILIINIRILIFIEHWDCGSILIFCSNFQINIQTAFCFLFFFSSKNTDFLFFLVLWSVIHVKLYKDKQTLNYVHQHRHKRYNIFIGLNTFLVPYLYFRVDIGHLFKKLKNVQTDPLFYLISIILVIPIHQSQTTCTCHVS